MQRAIRIADRQGLPALTMRGLARELSVTPMALYWHFADRDALLDAMAEQVAADAQFSTVDGAWHDRYRAALSTLAGLLRSHPWMGRLVIDRLVPRPHYLGALEILLDSSDAAGLGVADAVLLAQQAIQAVVILVECEPVAAHDPAKPAVELAALHSALDELPGDEFPQVRRAAAALTDPPDVDRYYRFGIDTIVRGVSALAAD